MSDSQIRLMARILLAAPFLAVLSFAVGVPSLSASTAKEATVLELVLADQGKALVPIVVLPDAGLVAGFAAQELKTYLDRVTGASFAIVDERPNTVPAVLVGDSPATRRLGLSVKDLKRDGFLLRRVGDTIALVGRDDKSFDIRRYVEGGSGWRNCTTMPECATVFAVYGFLERVAGVRWYFPGKDGEVVPTTGRLAVRDLDIRDEPRFPFRRAYMYGQRRDHDRYRRFHDYAEMGITQQDTTRWALRNRVSTAYPALNHMPAHQRFAARFAQSHPKWFALQNGKRANEHDGKETSSQQLCYSNPDLIAEIVMDVDAFFSGRPAQERNLPLWNPGAANGNLYSLLPNDSFRGCECSQCAANWSEDTHWSEVVWGYVAEVGRKIESRHPGKYVTCLSYTPFKKPPKSVNMPRNVVAGVALLGPCLARGGSPEKWQQANIREWKQATGNNVILWTYNAKEVLGHQSTLSGIPKLELRACGRFFQSVEDDVMGAFYENEIEYGFQNHLDLYIFQRVTWNPDADVDAILAEYCRTMYGPAADHIRRFLARAEDLWLERITKAEYQERHQRYNVSVASAREIWEEIYTPTEMQSIRTWLAAAKAITRGTEYAARVDCLLGRFVAPMEMRRAVYHEQREALRQGVQLTVPYFLKPPTLDGRASEPEWHTTAAGKRARLVLASRQTKAVQAPTGIRLGWDADHLYVMFSCQVRDVDDIVATQREPDDLNIARDDEVEVFLDPSNQREGCCQILVNAKGAVADLRYAGQKHDLAWNSEARVGVWRWQGEGKGAWYVEMAIPFAALGGPPRPGDRWAANLCRSRPTVDTPGRHAELSTWSPFIVDARFYQPEWFGQILFEGF